ncbi:hypothetical protein [Luteipulveratus halotolerans]|uniref:Lipoprotein n=1 Tax=Luteipulveratus halotolerans TaxID=1631356 RepID=A0A0L6CM82_9MICO|nr:hypothetical protein [Luteipulveratus halotolerans]KNX38745.1 hypothetical protein VV01_18940 [Luteipulveratus halotolerans]
MTRLPYLLAATLSASLLTACGSDTSNAPASTASPAAAATTSDIELHHAGRRYESALRTVRERGTSHFTVSTSSTEPGGTFSQERDVRIDAQQQRARVRVTMHQPDGSGPTESTLVQTPEASYLTSASWTGKRHGRWMKFTSETMGEHGVAVEAFGALAPSTPVPTGLDEVVATSVSDDGLTLRGTISAPAALNLLGMTSILRKDATLRGSLAGRAPITVQLHPNGTLDSATITGKGHTFTGRSTTMPFADFTALVTGSTAVVTIEDAGDPVRVTEPPASKIIPG